MGRPKPAAAHAPIVGPPTAARTAAHPREGSEGKGAGKLEHGAGDPRVHGELEDQADRKKKSAAIDPLDPSVRTTAHLGPPMIAPPPALEPGAPAQEVTSRARVSMEELLPLVVRRIAWGGDKTKAAVHVELGTGSFAGTTVTVHAEGRRVRLELGGAGDLDALRARLESRLRAAGIDVESAA